MIPSAIHTSGEYQSYYLSHGHHGITKLTRLGRVPTATKITMAGLAEEQAGAKTD